jgi:predicted RNA-binding protein YlqC (UPF0109 family)
MSVDKSVDQDILLNILKNLVTEPDSVSIDRKIDEQGVLLSVRVAEKDMGIVIGRSGSMANAIKTLMRAVGKAHKMNVRVQFVEPDGSLKYSAVPRPDKSKPEAQNSDQPENTEGTSTESKADNLDDDLKEFVIN